MDPPESPARPFRILVIDDDAEVREMVADLLEAAGYAVLQAESGEIGCALAAAESPDLILVDHCMPGLDGFATVRRLKATPTTRAIPVVGLTGSVGPEYQVLVEAGCIGYIPKPFEPTALRRVVGEFLKVTVARRRPP
jgi:CheY-like chemotaxis protein